MPARAAGQASRPAAGQSHDTGINHGMLPREGSITRAACLQYQSLGTRMPPLHLLGPHSQPLVCRNLMHNFLQFKSPDTLYSYLFQALVFNVLTIKDLELALQQSPRAELL